MAEPPLEPGNEQERIFVKQVHIFVYVFVWCLDNIYIDGSVRTKQHLPFIPSLSYLPNTHTHH